MQVLAVTMEVLHVRSQSRIHWKIECQLERGIRTVFSYHQEV